MFTKIYQSVYFRPLAIILAFSILCVSFKSSNEPNKVKLKAGTPILLEVDTPINSRYLIAGQTVDFRVRQDVIVDEQVVVKQGSIAHGVVSRVQKAKGLGKEGYVEIQIKSVTAVDGQSIPLFGANVYGEGQSQLGTAIVLGVLICILFLLIKGGEAKIPQGSPVDARSATDMIIEI